MPPLKGFDKNTDTAYELFSNDTPDPVQVWIRLGPLIFGYVDFDVQDELLPGETTAPHNVWVDHPHECCVRYKSKEGPNKVSCLDVREKTTVAGQRYTRSVSDIIAQGQESYEKNDDHAMAARMKREGHQERWIARKKAQDPDWVPLSSIHGDNDEGAMAARNAIAATRKQEALEALEELDEEEEELDEGQEEVDEGEEELETVAKAKETSDYSYSYSEEYASEVSDKESASEVSDELDVATRLKETHLQDKPNPPPTMLTATSSVLTSNSAVIEYYNPCVLASAFFMFALFGFKIGLMKLRSFQRPVRGMRDSLVHA
eukprot:gnl/TRDRNA2_/TRDRNA2_90665_c0_seq2.p1 gnl/TRDRNA2_/TRDRNA2_90665_c0~~gnl/TRDRNA2_/TRDRNA2_90665_c0_seq2.p1  ORF type:complete len:333 (+),score=49.56 gnl/TRDRNA2_/TRDRNA2_90665_c0_seq2:46-999(+)